MTVPWAILLACASKTFCHRGAGYDSGGPDTGALEAGNDNLHSLDSDLFDMACELVLFSCCRQYFFFSLGVSESCVYVRCEQGSL